MVKNARIVGAIAVVSALFWAVLNGLPSQEQRKAKAEYIFQPEPDKRVVLVRFPFFYEGHLNDSGAFVPDPKAKPVEFKFDEDVLQWMEALEKKKGPIFNRNRGGLHADAVYHFFGGWLIGGEIPAEDFFPQIEKNNTIKVISLDDYLRKYDPEQNIRIYNLPGRIVKKGEGETKDKGTKK